MEDGKHIKKGMIQLYYFLKTHMDCFGEKMVMDRLRRSEKN